MTEFERQKMTEVVLYVLHKTGGIDFYHLFKILYFAELKHLAKWGTRMLPDQFHALEYGPVPTQLYDAVKGMGASAHASFLKPVAHFAGADAPNVLLPNKLPDMDYISKSAEEALDESITENAGLTFNELLKKSHDEAWREAYHNKKDHVISTLAMAKVMGVDDATLSYIEDQLELDAALS
jgi:uncharacterized phage-associated protein